MKPDFTRYNRAGLERFRYVGGNAATYLELLRSWLKQQFERDGTLQWPELEGNPAPLPGESPRQNVERLLAQYQQPRADYGWEIARAFARASHVLLEHLDAYANEATLRTATQWDNVRRLVEMLDYHPAPPSSATTCLAFLAKPGQRATLQAGVLVKSQPKDGSTPVSFETTEPLDLDHELNELRPRAFDQSQEPFAYAPAGSAYGAEFPLADALEGVSVGTLGVLVVSAGGLEAAMAVEVAAVSEAQLALSGAAPPAELPPPWLRHQVQLLCAPRFRATPELRGDNTLILTAGHGLGEGDVVAWQAGSWRLGRVLSTQGDRLQLSGSNLPAAGASLYRAASALKQSLPGGAKTLLPPAGARQTASVWDANLNLIGAPSISQQKDSTGAVVLFDYVSATSYPVVYYVPAASPVASALQASPQALEFQGSPPELSSGAWVYVRTENSSQAARIAAIQEKPGSFELVLDPPLGAVSFVAGGFESEARPLDHDANTSPSSDLGQRSASFSVLPLALSSWPAQLTIGRRVLVVSSRRAQAATVADVDPSGFSIKIQPALDDLETDADEESSDYPRHDTRIYANVAAASHGETKPEKILGSGDATRSSQSFTLDVDDVAFLQDATQPSGVRAALELRVDGRVWQQVATLDDHGPDAAVYVVRVNTDGTLTLAFGDGEHGRRLPTGTNNVRALYRRGNGLSGNLAPYSLSKLQKPHAALERVLQPLPASGGNALEALTSLKENAPASALTLERAVSLSDFTHLAASHSAVWQARAFRLPASSGRSERIDVVVVPAGGGPLGGLGVPLAAYLQAHALPGVQVLVTRHEPVALAVQAMVRVKVAEYDPLLVQQAVLGALRSAFSVARARLGRALFLSDVVAVIEAVPGVEASQVQLNPGGFLGETGAPVAVLSVAYGSNGRVQRISPTPRQLIAVLDGVSLLEITALPYTP